MNMTNTSKLNQKIPSYLCSLREVTNAARESGGKYFGLDTIHGETINARFLGETNCYMTFYDRNASIVRSFNKKSISKVRICKNEYVVCR